MSSPAKLASQFTFKFSSEEKEKNLGQIREKFDEINDSKALQLHNQLTSLDMCDVYLFCFVLTRLTFYI